MTAAVAPIVALDVGGTALKGAVVAADLAVLAEREWPTPAGDGADAVVAAIAGAARQLCADAVAAGTPPPERMGLVVPGIVDGTRGVAVLAANLPFRETPLARLVGSATGLTVQLGHDVRAGGLAEAAVGAARGQSDVLFVALGTGIAGACIVDGRVLDGGGYAGEIGHVIVEPGGELCGCGQHGCLERVASAAALARRYERRTGRAVAGALAVEQAMLAGDPVAGAVWEDAVEALARVLHTACTLLGSAVVVLGGGLAQAGGLLLDPVRERLQARLTFQRRPTVVQATLGDRAGCLGAAILAGAGGPGVVVAAAAGADTVTP